MKSFRKGGTYYFGKEVKERPLWVGGGGMLAKMQRRSQLGKEHGMKVLGAKAGKLLAMSYI